MTPTMSAPLTTLSGVIKRVFLDGNSGSPNVKFTLENDINVHVFANIQYETLESLQLTKPGDEVTFGYEVTGLIFRDYRLRTFKNTTLDKELNR